MSFLELREVTKKYGTHEVILPLSFEVEKGEFVVLVGPSGCGKSTLLRMVAGLEDITSGEMVVSGEVMNNRTPIERDVAMVFQNYALYPHMTVRKNIGFALRLSGHTPEQINARVTEAAEVMGLGDLLDRYPRQLSGGQRQRVAMGRAIVREPNLFLFDEPLSNLDAKLRVQMRGEIRRLHDLISTTTLYVTHDQIEAMTLADRVVVLSEGRIEQVGKPIDLYDRPETLFVAGFIGSPAMNLIAGKVQDGHVTLPGHETWVDAPSNAAGEITVGVRPEHLALSDEGLPVVITAVEETGAETLLICEVKQSSSTRIEVLASLRDRPKVAKGDLVHLSAPREHFHYFATQSGQRLADPVCDVN